MKCPECGSEQTKVMDSRPTPFGRRWRRYKCQDCLARFTTKELYDFEVENTRRIARLAGALRQIMEKADWALRDEEAAE